MGEMQTVYEHELTQQLRELDNILGRYKESRIARATHMMEMATEIENYHRIDGIVEVLGSAADLIDNTLTLCSLLDSVFNFEESPSLDRIGRGMRVVERVSRCGSILIKRINTMFTSNTALELLQFEQEAYANLQNSKKEMVKTLKKFQSNCVLAKKVAKQVKRMGSKIIAYFPNQTVQIGYKAVNVCDSLILAFDVISCTPVDIHTLIIGSIDIYNSTAPTISKQLRELANKYDPPKMMQ